MHTENKKITVTVGIPAYNEEKNIGKLLKQILEQHQDNFILEKIIVISDGSSDNTAEEVKKIQDPRVEVIAGLHRLGQAARQNEILEKFHTGILVLINADILPKDNFYLTNIVKPFLNKENLGLVANRGEPLPAKTFIEKVINFSVKLKLDMVENLNQGDNVYLCNGRSRAFSEKFAKELRFGNTVAEDAYSYLFNKSKGYSFYYSKDAVINYRSPQTLTDHLKQSARFKNTREDLQKFFPSIEVMKEYVIPKKTIVKNLLKGFLSHPILLTSYILIQIYTFFNGHKINQTTVWEASESSKQL